MAKIKYIARYDNGTGGVRDIVGTRSSDRTYTHAVVTHGHGKGPHVAAWCGRLDLAQGEQRKAQRYGYTATIVPAEIAPSNARTAKALNDSGVFAPFTVVGKD
jgi:hypothetical protein